MALAFETRERELRVEASTEALMAAFSLSLAEAEFVQAILVGGWVGTAECPAVRLSIRQAAYTLRKKLEAPYGVRIINNGHGKYAMASSSKQVIARILQKKSVITQES